MSCHVLPLNEDLILPRSVLETDFGKPSRETSVLSVVLASQLSASGRRFGAADS